MRMVRVDAVHAMASCDNALIIHWRAAPEGHTVDGVRRAAEALLHEFPDGIGIVGVSGPMPLACADDRCRLAPLLESLGDRLLGLASVIEGGEILFRVINSVNLVVRHPCPLRVFSTVDDGVAWLAPRLDRGFPGRRAAALRHAVEGLRRETVSVLYS
jgi:hypothetical protein